MPLLELFDETLDINSTENYELSVQIGYDGLSYSVLDTLRNKFVLLRDYEPDENTYSDTGKLAELINKDDFLTRRYKKTNLIVPSSKSTLVPAPLFDSTKKEEYFAFNQTIIEGEKILIDELTDPDAIVIYSMPDSIEDLVRVSFPGSQLYHQLTPLFMFISINRRTSGSYYIHVHLEKDFFNLIIFDQNTLIFCNTFQYKTVTDLQYYVLYVLKRMNISQEEAIYFSGHSVNPREIASCFADYLKTIRFSVPSGNFTFSYVFNNTDLYRYLNLFTATNCA
jgi:hypothetical protein